MTFWYTAKGTFDNFYQGDGKSWKKYIEWSKLTHLIELISPDGILNEDLVEPNFDNEEDWKFFAFDGQYETGFYTTIEYVLKNIKSKDKFNLLAVVKEPNEKYKSIQLDDFEFAGYELLDKDYSISALTNCGGFDETFLPNELNQFGLISEYENAYDIRKRLFENNPEEHHAKLQCDCSLAT